ncbi:MAG: 5-bromo-4-chloroindolyl phosphate hydrolysis family protein [Lawsonibacter sp.]|nr:5-bromo-4-chloroindolyl phosphate hydrolysis family protein [Lawsonibacter sp.]
MKERDRALSEMRRLNDNIPDERISAQIDHLEEVTKKIIDQVVAQPKKLLQISRFMDYYLPTTLKILNAYDRMDSAGISGSNIDATKQKVEGMMGVISQAFDKQLDALFGEEALDISTDITVMENLLAREGLGGMNMGNSGKETAKSDGDDGVRLEL